MENASKHQNQYQPILAIIGDVPASVGDAQKDVENLRLYVQKLVGAMSYAMEHITLAQFADGEIGRIGGKHNG